MYVNLFVRWVGATAGLLVLVQAGGCMSPEDIGFEAGAKYVAPMAAIGADTKTTECSERLAMYEEFIGMENERADLKPKVEGALDKDGFDSGLKRMAPISVGVFKAFERDCPAEAPKAKELAAGVAKELGIEGKVPSLDAPT